MVFHVLGSTMVGSIKIIIPLLFLFDEIYTLGREYLSKLTILILLLFYYVFLIPEEVESSTRNWRKTQKKKKKKKKKTKKISKKSNRNNSSDLLSCQFSFFQNFKNYFISFNKILKYLLKNIFNYFSYFLFKHFTWNPNFYLLFVHSIILKHQMMIMNIFSFLYSILFLLLCNNIIICINLLLMSWDVYFSRKKNKRKKKNTFMPSLSFLQSTIRPIFQFFVWYFVVSLMFSGVARYDCYHFYFENIPFSIYFVIFFYCVPVYFHMYVINFITNENISDKMKTILQNLQDQNIMELRKTNLKIIIINDYNLIDSFIISYLIDDIIKENPYIFREVLYIEEDVEISYISLIEKFRIFVSHDPSYQGHTFEVHPSTMVQTFIDQITNLKKK